MNDFSNGGEQKRGARKLVKRRKQRLLQSWMMLGLEANQVIGLRILRLMAGGKRGRREAELMVSEKVDAAFRAGASLLTGASGEQIVHQYRRRVAANAKRLSKLSLNHAATRTRRGRK